MPATATRPPSPARRPDPLLVRRLFAPVDLAPLVYFRMVFGAVMLWEVTRYFRYGWIERYYIEPIFHFTYYGFGWVHPWPGIGMYLHFGALGVLAVCIGLGLWYRASAVLFFLDFTYVFLLEQANYLNHFYLIALVSFLMIFLPAHRACSLDVRRRPALCARTAPAWTLWLLRAQLGIAYFYGGLAKLNPDWLRGEPMRMWLADRTGFPLIGRWFEEAWAPYVFSYGGLLFDLLVVPLLFWRRTRPLAVAALLAFHLTNAGLFNIGIFPWFMLAATPIFFPPETLSALLRRLQAAPPRPSAPPTRPDSRTQRLVLLLLGVYLGLQLLVPLRHLLYPGNVSWTEEGHNFSWHMKLRSKSGVTHFFVTEPGLGQTWEVWPEEFLSPRQERKMATRPDLMLQFAHYLADRYAAWGSPDLEVRVEAYVALNGRPYRPLIDPDVDLAAQPRSLAPAPWILPLDEALPPTVVRDSR